ncbi:MAG TPA: carbamate kinase [Actinomycetota bacterium]|nr:carbamate kinase [Actinomycetota bacterium]
MRVVVALGGNAILQRDDVGTATEQRATIREACESIAALCEHGHSLILTHGNGPQVGRLLMQDEALPGQFPPLPLDVLVAQTQGQIGYLMQQEMSAALRRRRASRPVVTLVTQVVVDPADPAFMRPAKPVGPRLSEQRAAEYRARGELLAQDADGRWRRVVASPEPVAIIEWDTLSALVTAGAVPIVAGGGGVPVVREGNSLRGIAAVVDKDLTAALIADIVHAEALLILTDVERVVRGFGTADPQPIERITAGDARAGVDSGEFPPGSMGPKMLAAARVAESGKIAAIGALWQAADVLAGRAGTHVVSGR